MRKPKARTSYLKKTLQATLDDINTQIDGIGGSPVNEPWERAIARCEIGYIVAGQKNKQLRQEPVTR